ncbi:MAG TPA: hypothetical protein VFC00_32615 [Micromonosporaceae bacterium]|nr:hypothetical protein [Micromonosporaceae bacterium]
MAELASLAGDHGEAARCHLLVLARAGRTTGTAPRCGTSTSSHGPGLT